MREKRCYAIAIALGFTIDWFRGVKSIPVCLRFTKRDKKKKRKESDDEELRKLKDGLVTNLQYIYFLVFIVFFSNVYSVTFFLIAIISTSITN